MPLQEGVDDRSPGSAYCRPISRADLQFSQYEGDLDTQSSPHLRMALLGPQNIFVATDGDPGGIWIARQWQESIG